MKAIWQLGFALVIAFLPNEVSAAAGKEWERLENCRLVPNKDNDGDSFHIQCDGTEYLVRLYLVDAPETKGGPMADRLVEQAKYFGITVPEVVEIGVRAKKFVEAKLADPFIVQTRKASGLGRSNIERFYGFVQTNDGDLGQLLVANGLTRIHGTRAARPGSSKSSEEIETLQRLEQRAKEKKLGGWSQGIGASASTSQPMQTIALPSPSQTPSQPTVVVSTANSPSPKTPPVKTRASLVANVEKLDINTATKQQLEKIPGIGDALSDRIIAARPFRSADDLRKVQGIGSGKRYEEVRPFFK